ncbi:MAG: hypothetical protein OXT67_13320 [Zetaproteobacteria bacterium]|nr:hypothetical protein [Zetaproteobacteria bacterium]
MTICTQVFSYTCSSQPIAVGWSGSVLDRLPVLWQQLYVQQAFEEDFCLFTFFKVAPPSGPLELPTPQRLEQLVATSMAATTFAEVRHWLQQLPPQERSFVRYLFNLWMKRVTLMLKEGNH